MKPFLMAAIVFAALAVSPTIHADDAATKAVAEKFYLALRSHDPAEFKKVLTEDWVVHGTSPSRPTLSFDGYVKSLGPYLSAVTKNNYKVEAMYVAGDFVTVRGTITGVHSGPFLGVEASNKPVEFGAIDIHRIVGDRIAESWHVEDFITMYGQIGGLNPR
jgi:predicted ester cyclase